MNIEKILQALEYYRDYEGECEIDDISINDECTIEINGDEYLICTDEEANEKHYEYIENIILDLGLESFSNDFKDWIYSNAIDENFYNEFREIYFNGYINDIRQEGDRLKHEMEVFEVDNEEDFLQAMIDECGNSIDWFIEYFGIDELNCQIKENTNIINIEKINNECILLDGRGNSLAIYDGEEIELKDFYMYRLN